LKEVDADFKRVKPRSGELQEFDNQISKLESVEDLRIAVTGAVAALNDEEQGALNGLQQGRRFLQGIRGKDAELDVLHERIADSLLNLVDAAGDLERYLESLAADPNALENALQRRSILLSFLKKYGSSAEREVAFEEAITYGAQAAARISDLAGGDETIEKLKSQMHKVRGDLCVAAQSVSQVRGEHAVEFAKLIEKELHQLAMPKAKLKVNVNSKKIEDDADFQSHGVDDVFMEFTAHGGTELLPIAKAASGGELSRLMLGIEVVIAQSYPVGTYIFDEVDAGVGGKAALDVGRRLKELAKQAQVIVVTHLPQVAIWADHHLVVEKNIDGAVTESSIRVLEADEREVEIARMLSGLADSEHAQEHARELLNLRLTEKA
jgi:DNA repair protein RecN (Recombination protein N)